jgi:GNAT superfamily N-acetyltransferase
MLTVHFDILHFDESLIPAAGELLAARHRGDHQALPALPQCFSDPSIAAQAVAALWQRKQVTGMAALQDGRLLGYLLGELVIQEVWGRSAWVRLAGIATDPELGAEQSRVVLRHLYAHLADPWVEAGILFHFAQIPASRADLLETFVSLSFGIEQIYGLADLRGMDLSPQPLAPGVSIRPVTPADRPLLAEMSTIIWKHQVKAPVWGLHLPEIEEEHRQDYADLVDDPQAKIWLAFYQDQPAGMMGYFPAEVAPDNLLTQPDYGELSVAGTYPQYRRMGIGTALTHQVFSHQRESGYPISLTDWRSTNLLSAPFWPSLGFRPAMLRLVRRVDARILWGR